MASYLLTRTARLVASLVGLTMLLFLIMHLAPVNPIRLALGPQATAKQVAQVTAAYGLNRPLDVQYITYLGHLLRGNLGTSILTHQSVGQNLAQAFPATLELVIAALVLAVLIGVPLGVLSAVRRGGSLDGIIQAVAVGGVALPNFWLAVILQLIFAIQIRLFPLQGQLNGSAMPHAVTNMVVLDALIGGNFPMFFSALDHLVLPAVVLALWPLSMITRLTRASMLDVLPLDFVRTARAKGLPEGKVVMRHALRGAFGPVLAIVGLNFGWLLGGTFIIESIFDWPGIGQYAVNAALSSDFPAILGSAIVIGAAFAVINLIVDIVYAMMDPRVRYV